MATISKKKRKVNRAKPRKRPKSRAKAARKGWAKRRKNNPALAKKWRKKRAKEKARFAQEHRSPEQMAIELEVQRRVKIEKKKLGKSYEKLRSQLVARTIEQVINEAPPGFVETDFSIIRARMDMADISGDPEMEAAELAEEFNYDTREIYTIWYGSDPNDTA
jgi:hypothetical protein